MRTAVNCFLVNTGAKRIMVDCGGAKMLGPNAGRMPLALAQLGIDPGQVDEVYVTHMHGDHLHGAVTPDNQKDRFIPAKRALAAHGDRLQPFEPGAELTPGIRSVPAVGHTPGRSCYLVSSGQARLLLLGDTMHVAPVQFPRPEITVAFDFRQDQARTRRQELFEVAVKEDMYIAAVHLPFPAIGKLRASEAGGFAYEPRRQPHARQADPPCVRVASSERLRCLGLAATVVACRH